METGRDDPDALFRLPGHTLAHICRRKHEVAATAIQIAR